ncbi:MAG: alanine--tRNA ligase [Clostridia bacterium]|jgi:alanyl-tRNA synthetase|nr:alanine--tRNA ligase [Clostridia bacterium]
MFTDENLKDLWFKFFTKHGFKKIDGYSIIPENDPTVLFTTAGMHPLVPFLLGEPHPSGNRICDVQRCIRTNDIDSVGDDWHLTCFEMLGNWFLGDCPKEEMIKLSFEFLTSPEYLGLKKENLATSVFAGDETAPRDEIACNAWKACGIDKVFFFGKEDNWWALGGGIGPCGPDSEMFLVMDKPDCCEDCSPTCNCGKYVEIWNDVFMQYNVKEAGQKAEKLARPNIDTGMGLERTVAILNGAKSVYDTGCLKNVIDFIGQNAKLGYDNDEKAKRYYRIITDHLRSSVFILGDARGVTPSNVGQGYILRRFIRRAINCARYIGLDCGKFAEIVDIYVDKYGKYYEDIAARRDYVKDELIKEVEKFSKALEEGHKEFEKVINGIEKHKQFAAQTGETVENKLSGKAVFRLYDTFGFPFELTKELAEERGYSVDEKEFEEKFKEHQEKSRQAAAGQFKGGLADSSKQSAYLHTATHLLLAALQKKYGFDVKQRGSNITPERLRFDFNLDHKMTKEELDEIEKFVNDAIARAIPVECKVMSLEEAKESGAEGIFASKYGQEVKVYTIGDVSKEICGGPHAENTSQLHHFKIIKEESSSSGIRRIKAVID